MKTKILLPTAFSSSEIDRLLPLVKDAIIETCAQNAVIDYRETASQFEIGVSISVPRACITAEMMTRNTDISFATFDIDELTQLTFGVDQFRNETTMGIYEDRHLIAHNPFASLDTDGVMFLLSTATSKALAQRSALKVYMYGVPCSEYNSIRTLNNLKVDALIVPKNRWIAGTCISAAQAVLLPNKG